MVHDRHAVIAAVDLSVQRPNRFEEVVHTGIHKHRSGIRQGLLLTAVRANTTGVTAPFEFFEHTADIGVRVYGATLPELFANAARAIYTALGEFAVSGRQEKNVELQAETLEDLLHDWLAELLFEIEARQMLYNEFALAVEAGRLKAAVRGGKIDFARSRPREEIKAVTYHQLVVHRQPAGDWQAIVIFDV